MSRHPSPMLPVLVLALACAFATGCGPAPDPGARGEPRLSLFAVGDTGKYRTQSWYPDIQGRVAEGMNALDRARPVDALVLLGDNFYPDGLRSEDLVERLVMNLVRPYCRFVELEGSRSPDVAAACTLAEADRHPVPIVAVLGNHDYKNPEGETLQVGVVSEFVSNWETPVPEIQVRELGHGVSLVLLQSMKLVEKPKKVAALDAALREAKGPWRILVGHHPVVPTKTEHDAFDQRYMDSAREVIGASGVVVQLALAGHHHSLQALAPEPPGPALQVVSGSGSRAPTAPVESPALRFGAKRNGFVRVDLVLREGREELVVSIYSTRHPWLPESSPRLRSRWAIGVEGALREEALR